MNKMLSIVFCVAVLFASCNNRSSDTKNTEREVDLPSGDLPEVEAELTNPPLVPPPITRRSAAKVVVRLEVREVVKKLTEGVEYTYWTFGGTVPGKFIRIREGDLVEFHLMNHPDSKNPHNIDLHAVTGQGGGAASTFTAPGHETVFSFTALNPGLYVYHCATAPVGMHIANGMYGLIMVEPKDGLPAVDKEYYIMQGEIYTKGNFGDAGLQPFDMQKAIDENPPYVVFNGTVGAISGDNTLTAQQGEKIRLFVGNGGPNLVSSFHIIGEILDNVYVEAGSMINHDLQTTLIPAGGASIVEFKADVAGSFIIVDHSIFRAFNKGALGTLKVTGEGNKTIYSGQIDDKIYLPEGSTIQEMPSGAAAVTPVAKTKEERISMGKNVYTQNCQACHQNTGQGIPKAFPPLANSDFLNADLNRAIGIVLHGYEGAIKVNGESYNSTMPKLKLTDEEIANVLTYVYNSWGNKGFEVKPEQVAKARAAGE